MNNLSRRSFTLGALCGAPVLAGCANGVGSDGGARIDARVNTTESYLFSNYPNTVELKQRSTGMLVMPLMTEAGFGFGGGYGRGALRINGASVDYYSATKGTVGLQIGAKQFAHVLFFMTPDALSNFRRASGWTIGADVGYVVVDQAGDLRVDSTTMNQPVIAVVFGQAGLLIGAKLEGMKYTRVIP